MTHAIRCCALVPSSMFSGSSKCRRSATMSIQGKSYCAVHDPRKVMARKAKAEQAYTERLAKHRIEIRGPLYQAALKRILQETNPAIIHIIAKEALEK